MSYKSRATEGLGYFAKCKKKSKDGQVVIDNVLLVLYQNSLPRPSCFSTSILYIVSSNSYGGVFTLT
jgi:hypothetical protein